MPLSGRHLSSALYPLSSCTVKQRGKKKSLVCLAVPDFFLDSLPASWGTLAPFRLCSRSQPQSSPWDPTSEAGASASSPHPPLWVSRQASQAGECGWHQSSVRESLCFALCTPMAALSSVAPKLPLCHPVSALEWAS